MRYLFRYSGPVMRFDTIVLSKWVAETYAETETKAKSNFAYQFKKKYGLKPSTRVTLPGTITVDHNQKAI